MERTTTDLKLKVGHYQYNILTESSAPSGWADLSI
jgi:hypothetical protein